MTTQQEQRPDPIENVEIPNIEISPFTPARENKPKISDFQIQELIGVGNFGKVMKAYNIVRKQLCALKIVRKESIALMKHADHMINELEVLKMLSSRASDNECPTIMKIHSSFQDSESLYLELEYIQGCTLLSQIRINNPIVKSNLSMIFYTSEVLQTLEYLHQQNVVYRDLKPENILISMQDNGHLKLVDFGFAKQLKQGKTSTNCGTPVYLAPEILRGQGHSFEVDIWSLGVLMVELVSGQTPFHAEDS